MKIREWVKNYDLYLEKKLGIHHIDNIVQKDIIRRYALVVFLFIIIAMGVILKAGIIMFFERPVFQIPKDIKFELCESIYKGCNFDDAKYIFDNEKRINITSIRGNGIEVYKLGTDFIDVLNDMIYDYYQQDKVDTFYINKLYQFKIEAQEKYPFDKLNIAQKELFKRLRDDAGKNYRLIEDDVLAIASELQDKNEDIEKYLSDAENSYILSIIAFYISLIPFLIPLWKWFKKFFS